MKYKPLGRTDLQVSEICLGTMTFGGSGFWQSIGQLDQEEVNELVQTAVDRGVNFFDTASIYSNGAAERMLGKALKDLKLKRSDVVIATKAHGRTHHGDKTETLTRTHIMTAVKESLARLDTDYIDLYQIHGVDLSTPLEEILHALDDLVSSGMVRHVGCSNVMAWQIMKALIISASHNWARFETVQAHYSIATRDIEREIVPIMESEQMGLMVWSPLAGGLLTGKFRRGEPDPEEARRTRMNFPPVNREHVFSLIDVITPIADKLNVSVAKVALAWLLHQKHVMSVIVGARTIQQLKENLAAADLSLSKDDLAVLDKASALKPEYPRWMIDHQNIESLSGI